MPVSMGIGAPVQSVWVEGPPGEGWLSRLGGGAEFAGRDRLPIRSYRCSGCGYLEQYAPTL